MLQTGAKLRLNKQSVYSSNGWHGHAMPGQCDNIAGSSQHCFSTSLSRVPHTPL